MPNLTTKKDPNGKFGLWPHFKPHTHIMQVPSPYIINVNPSGHRGSEDTEMAKAKMAKIGNNIVRGVQEQSSLSKMTL